MPLIFDGIMEQGAYRDILDIIEFVIGIRLQHDAGYCHQVP